jgi:fructokinase
MPDENSAEFVFYRNPGADQRLEVNDLDLDLLESTKAFHFGSPSLTHEPSRSATIEAARIARKGGALVSYDVNYRPSLWKDPAQALDQARKMLPEVDLVKVNEEEAALLTGRKDLDPADPIQVEESAVNLLEMGPELVVLTLGPEGSYFQAECGGGYAPPFEVETVDAVGCGDAFVAGMLTKLVEGGDWKQKLNQDQLMAVLRFSNAVGALTSLKRGAIPAMPTIDEVNEFLASRK